MRKAANRLKRVIASGSVAYGAYVTIASPLFVETIGGCGFDFCMLDTEVAGPGPFDSRVLGDLIRACELYGMTPLVRVPENDRSMILKALSIGAQGVVVSHCRSADDARSMVEYSLFPPLGSRGLGPSRGLHDVAAELPSYVKQSNEETLVVPLVEDREGVDALHEILSVPGIEMVFLGPGDLSASLGHPGELGHEEVAEYLRRARSVCRKSGKCTMDLAGDADESRRLVAQGCRALLLPDDILMVFKAYSERLDALRRGASEASGR